MFQLKGGPKHLHYFRLNQLVKMDTMEFYAVINVTAFKAPIARWKTEHVRQVVAQRDGRERLVTSEVSLCNLIVWWANFRSITDTNLSTLSL